MPLQAVENRRLYRQIADQIAALIDRGEYSAGQRAHGSQPELFGDDGYGWVWAEWTLQNWQSEFLAVASMSILAVYLRQRGSPESKPVGTPHDATGVGG